MAITSKEIVASRERQQELFGKDTTLPEVCIWLRAGVNGSAEPWPDEEIKATMFFLRERLRTWVDTTHTRSAKFDKAVQDMVLATIDEVNSYGHIFW